MPLLLVKSTLNQIKDTIKVSKYQKAEEVKKAIFNELLDDKKQFDTSDNNEGRKNESMGISGAIIAVVVIGIAIIVISFVGVTTYLKVNNMTILSHNKKRIISKTIIIVILRKIRI